MSQFFGDHPDTETEWLDDCAVIIRCPRCGNDAYARARTNSGAGFVLHRHIVVGCPPCGAWQCVCIPDPIPQPDVNEHAR